MMGLYALASLSLRLVAVGNARAVTLSLVVASYIETRRSWGGNRQVFDAAASLPLIECLQGLLRLVASAISIPRFSFVSFRQRPPRTQTRPLLR